MKDKDATATQERDALATLEPNIVTLGLKGPLYIFGETSIEVFPADLPQDHPFRRSCEDV